MADIFSVRALLYVVQATDSLPKTVFITGPHSSSRNGIFSVLYQIAYVSLCRTRLNEELLLDILSVSKRNNTRDGVSGILMYHDQMFFQILEGERTCVKKCYARILCDPRHSAISLMWEGEAESRTFTPWALGYAGPDAIGFNSGHQQMSLADLASGKDATMNNDTIAFQMALHIFQSFSSADRFGQSVSITKPYSERRTSWRAVSSPSALRFSSVS
jgi:hypothetical protein